MKTRASHITWANPAEFVYGIALGGTKPNPLAPVSSAGNSALQFNMTRLVGVATAGAFVCAAFAAVAQQTVSTSAMITHGASHVCELTSGGGVRCWGYNGDGELGDGSTVARLAPVEVTGLARGVRAIAAGGYHTCALTNAGAVKCWGRNVDGQLGNPDRTAQRAPVDVVGLAADVVAITAGGSHTCALTGAGAVKCWGYNRHGQLGNGSTLDQAVPVVVAGLGAGVTAIAAGANHTCALVAGGALRCWGYNDYGQLGDRTAETRVAPVAAVALATPATAITAGLFHTCALTGAGWVRLGTPGVCGSQSRG